MKGRTILFGVIVVVAAFVGATLLLNVLWPKVVQEERPQLTSVPRSSRCLARRQCLRL